MARYAWLGGLVLAIGVVVGVVVGIHSDNTKTLRIFIWEEYIDPEVYRLFEREFGAKVIEDNYGSNEDMRAKLQAGAAVYDLVVPSDYMVMLLKRDGLLLPIDLSRIPNLKHLAARFRDRPTIPAIAIRCPISGGSRASATTKARSSRRQHAGPTYSSPSGSSPTRIVSACSTTCVR